MRDLSWSCFGPSLVTDFSSANNNHFHIKDFELTLTQKRIDWLQGLDNNPLPLHRYLSTVKSTRLGLYFEALWQYFFRHDPDYMLIAHNLPVYSKPHTLGEYDLILFQQQTNRYYHLELAVKFFLNSSRVLKQSENDNTTNYVHWLGPNTNDRLDKKVHRFLNHQTQLSVSKEGIQALEQCGLARKEIAQMNKNIALKGCLFYPEKWQEPTLAGNKHTAQLASDHRRGTWFTLSDFIHSNAAQKSRYWQTLHKSCWISPAFIPAEKINDALSGEQLLNSQQLKAYLSAYFRQQKRPLLITAMEEHQAGMFEQSRSFITPDHWPHEMK